MTKIIAIADDDIHYDVTDAVAAMYDSLIHSMDWGSQFLSVEEVAPIVRLARICKFKGSDEAERYMNYMLSARLTATLSKVRAEHPEAWSVLIEHSHVYNEHGVCVWPLCQEREPEITQAELDDGYIQNDPF